MSSEEEEDNTSISDRIVSNIGSAILFGNIDDDGKLADDIFDDNCKEHLSFLQPHLSSLFSYEDLLDNTKNETGELSDNQDNEEFGEKLPDAYDYSDINEMIEEEQENIMKDLINKNDDDYDDYDENKQIENEHQKDKDGFLIPQPIRREAKNLNEECKEKSQNKKPLDTPLAAMLPLKYADMDVTELFPEFRHNQVLRFSRLFGPGKSSSLPQLWKHVKNKRKNRHIFENKLFIVNSKSQTVGEKEWKVDYMPLEEYPEDRIEIDDETKLLNDNYIDNELNKTSLDKSEENVADWRYGPGRFWYDRLKVPENGEGFDYGFKLKNTEESKSDKKEININNFKDEYCADMFNMVTQIQWENDIIWNGEEMRQTILPKLNDKNLTCGWIPSGIYRTASAFKQQQRATTTPKSTLSISNFKKNDKKPSDNNSNTNGDINDEFSYSMFPIENEELIYGLWEEDIIWDSEAVDKIPSPKLLVLDRNDENIILEVPNDEDFYESKVNVPAKEKKEGIRKSRLLLGKAGVIAEPEVFAPPSPPSNDKDMYNISNDEYYSQKNVVEASLKSNAGNNLIQHSIPALELRRPFFPTHLNYQRLRAFHRPALKAYSHGAIADTLPHGVNTLEKHIKRKAKMREQERIASGGGTMFFMRTPEDLTGKDGDLILTEYSEEYPPLLMQVGMASKIKNYYRRKFNKDVAPSYQYGETMHCQSSPFLGNLQPGQSIHALENNLFRAPIYEHSFPDSDFLIIRTRDNYFIREVKTIYTVGQLLPLYEVPGPNSKKANMFIRDFLQVFIYRLFWKSPFNPRRIKMDDIKKAFPLHSESSIRKRLKQCADFKRTGMDSNWWVIKSEFRLPSEDEMRAMVSPEACCAYYSMLSAEQRLKDAGYGDKSMFAPDDAEDEDLQVKIEDEVKAAPWNTTRAFISAMKGKCLLQLTGVADPTGCGEGFSYVRIPNKPQQPKEEAQKEQVPKKTVTGTDADLRRLPLNAAKQLLKKFGLPDDEIKKLSRWEVIDVVRTLSTKQAKESGEGGEDDAMSKFARGNRFSIAEHQERYKEECQRIFNLQNRVLASTEDLSTDEDESEEEDSEIEELGKNIESMLANKKTINQISRDKEEEERLELKKLLLNDESNQENQDAINKKRKEENNNNNNNTNNNNNDDDNVNANSTKGRLLKIYRTFIMDGKEVVRIEVVRNQAVIDTYVRVRNTKDESFIRQFASALDDQQKEEKRREKRRLQEQMRRQKRNQEKEKLANSLKSQFGLNIQTNISTSTPVTLPNESVKEPKTKKAKKEKETNLKLTCGACGGVGHMRTNRACPAYKQGAEDDPNVPNEDLKDLVKTDVCKLVLPKSVLKNMEEEKQQEKKKEKKLVIKIPKEASAMKRKKRIATNDNCDYLQKPDYKSANRCRTDPLISLSDIFEEILNEVRTLPDAEAFQMPVNVKMVPDYYKIIEKPMNLQLIRENIRNKRYRNREDFMNDFNLIVKNSELYNGINHFITLNAKKMTEACFYKIAEKEDVIIKLEKTINPLLDGDQTAFSYIIKTIVSQKLKTIPDIWSFVKPVNKKIVKNYYDIITNPMDLETLENNVQNHKYQSIAQFLDDVELIYTNCCKFNGLDNPLTKKAAEIVEVARAEIEQYKETLIDLERSLLESHLILDNYDDSNMADYDDNEPPMKKPHLETDDYYGEMDKDKSYSPQFNRDIETDIVANDLQITPQNSEDESDGDVGQNDWHHSSEANQANPEQYHSNVEMVEEDNFDENYDPSEFLLKSSFAQQSNFFQQQQEQQQQQQQMSTNEMPEQVDVTQDLDVSDSDESNENNDEEDSVWF